MFDSNVDNDPKAQIESLIEFSRENLTENLELDLGSPNHLLFSLKGRYMQILDLIFQSKLLKSNPLISVDVSYHWYQTICTISDEKLIEKEIFPDLNHLATTNALLSKNHGWLCNINAKDLIKIRQNNYIPDIRSVISSELSDIKNISLDDLNRVSNKIDDNLRIAFENHQQNKDGLKEKLKNDLKIDVTSLMY